MGDNGASEGVGRTSLVSMKPLSIDACQLGGCGFWKRMAGKGKEGGGREETREGP